MSYIVPEQAKTLDMNAAKVEISNRVYAAATFFEQLENAGKVRGNGHHMAQAVAEFAEKLLVERWIPSM